MWQIVDHTEGRILGALQKQWGSQVAQGALRQIHSYGAALDIADELAYLGFAPRRDFDVRPARGVALRTTN